MKVCIVGAGAIGGWVGTRMAVAGEAQVSALARGATLEALQTHGWRLEEQGGLKTAPAVAAADAGDLGPQDLVVIAVKGPALTTIAGAISPLLSPDTVVLPLMNGVPWWFGFGTELGTEPLASVDPGGRVAETIGLSHVLGGVVHASCVVPEPGLVHHKMGNGLIIGEPAGGLSDRSRRIADLLLRAGFDASDSDDVRYDIWYKLWGNMTMNPISALTRATADQILGDPLVRDFWSTAMEEAALIGRRLGSDIKQTPEDRHAVTAKLGAFMTSMLQDAEAGGHLELDSLLGAVHEMGGRLRVETPAINALLGLTRLAARQQGLLPETPAV